MGEAAAPTGRRPRMMIDTARPPIELRNRAWPLRLVAGALVWACVAGAALAAEVATLERPTFDRQQNAVVIPYQGPTPRFETESDDEGTRHVTEFSSSAARLPTAYKLGLFHPLVSRVEMAPLGNGKVRVTVWTSQPASLSVSPERNALRLLVAEAAGTAVAAAPTPPPAPRPTPRPVAQTRPTEYPGMEPLTPTPPPTPQPLPSLPPTARTGSPGGTPSSGGYVYRKAIPSHSGDDVTEIEVRTPQRAAIQVNNDPRSQAVVVNVVRPGERPELPVEYVVPERPVLPNEPWRLPTIEAAYRPVAALDALVGYTIMGEKATNFGTDFLGQGATLWGFNGALPVSSGFNVNLGAEGYGYVVRSAQVPEASTLRNEYFVHLQTEFLPIRRPWVLAVGPGYWARYITTTTTDAYAPPEPSLLFVPAMIQHGPVVNGRVYYPLTESLGLSAEGGVAPFMLGGNDTIAASIGNLYGAQGLAAVKWGNRHVALTAGYRHLVFGNYARSYLYHRGGPEVSLVWRF